MKQATSSIGTYLIDGVAGNEGVPGAPILRFSLVVNAVSGKISGQAKVTQAVAPPYNEITIPNVTGQIIAAGFGSVSQLVSLDGQALVSFPPPAIGSYLEPFHAHFGTNGDWQGKGGWRLGNQKVEDVPVHPSTKS